MNSLLRTLPLRSATWMRAARTPIIASTHFSTGADSLNSFDTTNHNSLFHRRGSISQTVIQPQGRSFSTEAAPAATQKLCDILEAYRSKNMGYTQFRQFVRQMVTASDANLDGVLNKKEFRSFLNYLEVTMDEFSDDDLDQLYEEMAEDETIDLYDMEDLAESIRPPPS